MVSIVSSTMSLKFDSLKLKSWWSNSSGIGSTVIEEIFVEDERVVRIEGMFGNSLMEKGAGGISSDMHSPLSVCSSCILLSSTRVYSCDGANYLQDVLKRILFSIEIFCWENT